MSTPRDGRFLWAPVQLAHAVTVCSNFRLF